MRVLCLHFCYAISSKQYKTYSINPILKLNTPIKILHRLSLEEKWGFMTCPMELFLSHATKTIVTLDKNSHKNWLQNLIFLLVFDRFLVHAIP